MRVVACALAVTACLALLVGCAREEPTPSKSAVDESLDPGLAAFEEKRLERERQLDAMPLPQLAEAVAADSAQHVEPFNSAAVRELKGRGPEAAREFVATLRAPDARSHLGLLTLLEVNPTVYRTLDPDFRYRVLTDALKTATYFNAWGVPHLFLDQPAGRAIVCEDPGIEKYLYTLLDDTREARIWGSSEVAEDAEEYQYRVKDYAWALIYAQRDQAIDVPTSPKDRDGRIDETRKQPPKSARARVTTPRSEICQRYGVQAASTTAAAE